MKCHIVIDPAREEEIFVYAHQRSALTDEIQRLAGDEEQEWIGYRDKVAVRLDPAEVCCVFVEDGKVFAMVGAEKYWLKQRLYQLEERLPGNFVKINQSCLANLRAIQKFDASFSGTLRVIFRNGHSDYVSRRQLKQVKERLGL